MAAALDNEAIRPLDVHPGRDGTEGLEFQKDPATLQIPSPSATGLQ